MAGALSCTGHAVTCSGARPVDHKNFTNEVELKQYNELVLAADTLSASAVEAVYMLPHVALTYAFTKKFKRAFASRQNQSLQLEGSRGPNSSRALRAHVSTPLFEPDCAAAGATA